MTTNDYNLKTKLCQSYDKMMTKWEQREDKVMTKWW